MRVNDSDSKAPIELLPEHWRIEDFFVAAAKRKGATGIERIKDVAREIVRQGKSYKIQYDFGPVTFVIHSDGTWLYQKGKATLTGRLQCPHAKGWIKKMIDKGTPGEFARADWAAHFAIRHRQT